MKFPKLELCQLVSTGQLNHLRRWFLIETTMTTDGPRTRVCDGRWETLREAQDEMTRREKEVNK